MFKKIRKTINNIIRKLIGLPKIGIKKTEIEVSVTDKDGKIKAYRKIKNGRTVKSSDY